MPSVFTHSPFQVELPLESFTELGKTIEVTIDAGRTANVQFQQELGINKVESTVPIGFQVGVLLQESFDTNAIALVPAPLLIHNQQLRQVLGR